MYYVHIVYAILVKKVKFFKMPERPFSLYEEDHFADYHFNPENIKQISFGTPGAPYDVMTHIDVIARGSGSDQRRSNQFKIKQVRWISRLLGATAGPVHSSLLLWDLQPNKALPVIADTVNNGIVAVLKSQAFGRFILIDSLYPERLVVGETFYKDKVYDINQYVTTTDADTTGAIGNRVSGALILYQLGNANSANFFEITFENV